MPWTMSATPVVEVASMVAEAYVTGVVVPTPRCAPVGFQKRSAASFTWVSVDG